MKPTGEGFRHEDPEIALSCDCQKKKGPITPNIWDTQYFKYNVSEVLF
jgi:hypothetical protein